MIVSDCVAVVFELSLTRTVNVAEPAVVGVPLITPAADKLKLAGNDPETTDHAYPPVPPLAESV